MNVKKLKNTVIEIVHGGIITMNADVIVIPSKTSLRMDSGVSAALKAKGGAEIETQAIQKAPAKAGTVVYTGAGKLDAKYLIHAVVEDAYSLKKAEYVKKTFGNSLILAEKLKMQTVMFSALGTGARGLTPEKSAEIMFGEAAAFDAGCPGYIKRIYFVLFAKRAFDSFMEKFRVMK